jgi:Flp pilus assembly protein TadD
VFSANVHAARGHFDLAIAEHQRALALEPDLGLANHSLGRTYVLRGDLAAGLAHLRKSTETMGRVPFALGDLGYALAVAGQLQEAERLLADLKSRREKSYYPAFPLAFYMPSTDPLYAALRTHPRFRALLARLRLSS